MTEISRRAFESDLEVGAPGEGGPPGYDSVEWNENVIKAKWAQYYKVLLDDEIVGGFIAGWRSPGYHVCERIFVEPDNFRRGIGEGTFRQIWEKYQDAQVWTLGTPEWNLRTQSFYEKVGFAKIGTTQTTPTWRGIFYEKQMNPDKPFQMPTIESLQDGDKRVLTEGTIADVTAPRTVSSRKTGDELHVANAILSDESGSITLVLWNEKIEHIALNDRIRIENGSVKRYQDDLQLTISDWSEIIRLE